MKNSMPWSQKGRRRGNHYIKEEQNGFKNPKFNYHEDPFRIRRVRPVQQRCTCFLPNAKLGGPSPFRFPTETKSGRNKDQGRKSIHGRILLKLTQRKLMRRYSKGSSNRNFSETEGLVSGEGPILNGRKSRRIRNFSETDRLVSGEGLVWMGEISRRMANVHRVEFSRKQIDWSQERAFVWMGGISRRNSEGSSRE